MNIKKSFLVLFATFFFSPLNSIADELFLRGGIDDLTQASFSSPTDTFKGAKSATIGLSNNNLIGGHAAWNSDGALGYFMTPDRDASHTYWTIIPNISWNFFQVQGGPTDKNVEDINFSLPVAFLVHPNGGKNEDPKLLAVQARPYFQTDFSFGYKIYGAEVSVEPYGYLLGQSRSFLYFGDFQGIGRQKSAKEQPNIAYQLRIIPKLDYSVTSQADMHTSRKVGDDWVRVGGLASLAFRFSKPIPFDVGGSFETLQSLGGNGNAADLFSAYSTYWLNPEKNFGITAKYSKGNSLVTAQKTDLFSIMLSFKL